MKATRTLKLRIKDKHASALAAMSREVNTVWNYCNELSHSSIRERQKWLGACDLQKYTAGYSKCDGVKVGSATVQLVCEELRAGSISQDARGRWYLNVCVEVDAKPGAGTASIGIDLGLKTAAVCSSGDSLASRTYRKYEPALAISQRARKKGRTRAIHAKIANVRKDAMHKFSTRLVAGNAAIFVGNVSGKALIKTKMAKSTLDAGWSMFK